MYKPSLMTISIIFLLATLAAVGCSEEPAVEEGQPAADSGVSVSVTVRDAENAQAAVAEPLEDPVADLSLLEVGGSTESQTSGVLVDGLRLDDIRWGDHGDYVRVVFDLSYTSGETLEQSPYASAAMSSDTTEIELTLGGIRGISEQPGVIAEELTVGDTLVGAIIRVPSMDDQALIYRIVLEDSASYTLDSLGDPGRVIVDIYR